MESQGMTHKHFKVFLRTLRWVVINCRTIDEIINYLDQLVREA